MLGAFADEMVVFGDGSGGDGRRYVWETAGSVVGEDLGLRVRAGVEGALVENTRQL